MFYGNLEAAVLSSRGIHENIRPLSHNCLTTVAQIHPARKGKTPSGTNSRGLRPDRRESQ